MIQPAGGLPRLLRAVAFALLAVGAGAVGHSRTGMPLTGSGLLFALLVTAPIALLVTGRRVRMPLALALLAGGQGATHLCFTIAEGMVSASATAQAGAAGAAAQALGSPGLGHANHGDLALGASPSAMTHPAMLPSASMVVAHLLAALVLAALLAWGERILWASPRLWPRLPVARAYRALRLVPPSAAPPTPRRRAQARPRVTRGPPVSLIGS